MAKLSRRDILAYLLLGAGVIATANPNIVQGILDKLAPVAPVTYGSMVLGDGDEPHATQGATADATRQATEQSTGQSTQSAELAVTPPADQPTKAP